MSKITPKNLQYDSSLPPFLQRMQAAQNSSSRDGRHEFATARPKRVRTEDEEREDEPVYFDDTSGETLTKGEWEEREKGKEENAEENTEVNADAAGENKDKEGGKEGREKEKLAAIGAGKKRKAGRVVGGDEEEQDGKATESKKVVMEKNEMKKVEKGKAAKKGKKIKLSFGDDE